MASLTETTLISKLETSTSTPIFPLFSDYFLPFTELTDHNTKSKIPPSQTLIRSLAKQFLPFLNRCLSLLPKRLSGNNQDIELSKELFDVYRLCLNCLESVSSQLSCKPYTVCYQRVRLVHCLEASTLYREAVDEAFRMLERLREIELGEQEKMTKTKKKKLLGKYLPVVPEVGGDAEFSKLLMEVVVLIVKCLASEQIKDDTEYRRVAMVVEELIPWFRVLDANAFEKLHRMLVVYLGKCTTFMVGELTNFDRELVRSFCVMSLNEYARSSLQDQLYKFARRICSSLFFLQNDGCSIIDMLTHVLDFLADKCKVDVESSGIEFLELVCYCSNKCRSASADFANAFSEHLNNLASEFCVVKLPLESIVRLYAVGLSLANSALMSEVCGVTSSKIISDQPAVGHSILVSLLNSLEGHFNGASLTCVDNDEKSYLLVYFNALKFLCQPLAEMVNTAKYQIATKDESISVSSIICSIQEAFHQFCHVSLLFKSTLAEMVKDGFDENKLILSVSVASFVLSIGLKLRLQKSVRLLKHIIDSEWIQLPELKYLFANLYNIGVSLCRSKQVIEASKALKLCCRAAWTCVKLHFRGPMNKHGELHTDNLEDSVQNVIDEASKGTALLLDVLHQCGSSKLNKIIVNTFESWSIAEDLFTRLPSPRTLVKQWVKIECKLRETMETKESALTLYSLLLSSGKVSKKTIGKILEQELLAYEEIDSSYADDSQTMQMKIIDILLRDFYVMQDSYLQRSRIILKKALALRACGSEGLYDSVQCVTEAISLMTGRFHLKSSSCFQQSVAYILRALCIYDAEPNSEQVFQDIKEALNLWLSISIDDYNILQDEAIISLDRAVLLLYNVIDLLSVKGSVEFHNDIYELMIRLFKHKNVPVEKLLSILWQSRRLSHGLCVSPINDALIVYLSGAVGEQCKFVDFWLQCFKGSPPSLLSFQHSLSFFFESIHCSSYEHRATSNWNITVHDIKQAVVELLSNVPMSMSSISIVGYLCYDLCERLLTSGKMYEALACAKEAHRLRTKLFQEKFMYSIEQKVEKYTDTEHHTERTTYGIQNLKFRKSTAYEVWAFSAPPIDMEACYLSPWKVLQCYLESTLQVGIVHEIIGNGVEAESFLLWGKSVACKQSLLPFIASFSSVLGKLYCNKKSWDLSEKELQSAKQILLNNYSAFPCLKCTLILEAIIDQHLGDLFRSRICSNAADVSVEKRSLAETYYYSAIEKLNSSVWKQDIRPPEDVEIAQCWTFTEPTQVTLDYKMTGPKEKKEGRKCRKTKIVTEPIQEQPLTLGTNRRVTRSRYCPSKNHKTNISNEVQSGPLQHRKDTDGSDVFNICSQQESVLDMKSSTVNPKCEFTRICTKAKCWSCIGGEVKKFGQLRSFIHMKWEFVRRQIFLRVLSGIGTYLEVNGQIHEAHVTSLQSLSLLVSQNPFSQTSCHIPVTLLLDFVGKEFPGDVLAVERAMILYNICWFSLKSYSPEVYSRNICCELSHFPLPQLVTWLMLAFILSCEVPMLFQKISRLLSSIFLLSSTNKLFSLPSYTKKLSESQWASYFHQASLGTHLSHHLYLNMAEKHKVKDLLNEQGLNETGSMCLRVNALSLPRLAPDSLHDLEQFVTDFFSNLPTTTVICLSVIGGSFASLLRELLSYAGSIHAWVLLSRLHRRNLPIVLLLPMQSVLEGVSDDEGVDFSSRACSENDDSSKHWHCPWGSTLVDDVAPAFKLILEENYLSSSTSPSECTKMDRTLWWNRRKKLDCRLHNFLRSLEDSWLGAWSIALLGETSSNKNLDSVSKKLARNLKTKCKMDVNQSLLKIILGSAKNATECESCISQLFSLEEGCITGCIIGEDVYSYEEKNQRFSKNPEMLDQQCGLVFKLFCEAWNELEEDDSTTRKPVILVLDFEVQMLPWENMPILRSQEVYRMPSVASISWTLDRNCQHQERSVTDATSPCIDPLDAFYVLNPSGDLTSTQIEFENWFRDQNLEGKSGSPPSAQELALALRSHDLFIYFGHGSGAQYISQQEVQKLENCGASLLMGCSSGCLSLKGSYVPQGAPLSYLQAGSPVIVANLWEVTDKDIDRFGRAMLEAWLNERSRVSNSCSQCDVLAKEFEAMNIKGGKAIAKKKAPKKKGPAVCDSDSSKDYCDHGSRIGSFMGQAREACMLRYLIGASPVCYGVPTGIRRKRDL